MVFLNLTNDYPLTTRLATQCPPSLQEFLHPVPSFRDLSDPDTQESSPRSGVKLSVTGGPTQTETEGSELIRAIPPISAIAQKRTVVSTWNLADLLIQKFDIVGCENLFCYEIWRFLDMVDFVTSLHATFGRKLAKLRRSVKDAFSSALAVSVFRNFAFLPIKS